MSEVSEKNAREEILEVACKLFAEKGYKSTTIRDICKEANTYQVSVNYYFGNKENLFKEACVKAYEFTNVYKFLKNIKQYKPEDQLTELVRSRLSSIFSNEKDSWFYKILSNEENIAYTLEVKDYIMKNVLEPHYQIIHDIMKGLLGYDADEFDVNFCCIEVIAQTMFICKGIGVKHKLFGTDEPSKEQIEQLVKRSVNFLKAGINDIKSA